MQSKLQDFIDMLQRLQLSNEAMAIIVSNLNALCLSCGNSNFKDGYSLGYRDGFDDKLVIYAQLSKNEQLQAMYNKGYTEGLKSNKIANEAKSYKDGYDQGYHACLKELRQRMIKRTTENGDANRYNETYNKGYEDGYREGKETAKERCARLIEI